MKRFLRILIGTALFIAPMTMATWIWLFTENEETWVDSVGYYTWSLISGNWQNLPD